MHRILILFILFGMNLNNCMAQNSWSVSNIPVELIENANTVIRSSETFLNVNSPGEAVYSVRQVVTLLNESSPANTLVVHYSSMRKVQSISAKMYDARGNQINNFKSNQFEDVSAISRGTMYSDSRVKYLSIDYNTYPFTIEFEYRVLLNDIIDYPDWTPQNRLNQSVEYSSYSISHPDNLPFRHKVLQFKPKYRKNELNGESTHQWETKNLKPIQSEPLDPHFLNLIPRVLIAPTLFEASGYKGDMSDWKSYGTFYYNLNKGRDQLSQEMESQVKSLVAKASTDREKIEILYRFLQENNRYVSIQLGIGGWQTFEANYVEENKYGDCKALTNFMKSMLKVVDINAYEALIYAGNFDGAIQSDFSQNEFNHVILYVPEVEDGIWLECTSQVKQVNQMGDFTDDRFTLLVTPTGGELRRTPKSSPADHISTNKITSILDADGNLNVQLKNTSTGNRDLQYRRTIEPLKEEDQKNWFKDAFDLPSFRFSKLDIQINPDSSITNCALDIDVNKYASISGKRIFIKPNILNRSKWVPKKIEERKSPITRDDCYIEEDFITIDIPEGYQIESNSIEDKKLESPFGSYEVTCSLSGSQIQYYRKQIVQPFYEEADQYDAYRDFLRKIKKYDATKLVLVANP